jgi:hypothetical protein
MLVIAGSPLDLLAQQFDAHEADQFSKVLHDGDEIRVVAACATIAESAGRFLIQRKHIEEDGAEYWQAETWVSSPVAAAMWALI